MSDTDSAAVARIERALDRIDQALANRPASGPREPDVTRERAQAALRELEAVIARLQPAGGER